MDSTTLTTDKVELATISRDEADGGRVRPFPASAEIFRARLAWLELDTSSVGFFNHQPVTSRLFS
jgi:hypothetical protein